MFVPGVGGFVEFDPGTVDPEPGVAERAGGVAGLAGGVAERAGGVAELAGGVAVPGACACPAPELPPGAAPPEGALCAITQVAQKISVHRKQSFFGDIGKAS